MVAAWNLHKSSGIDDDVTTVACCGALFGAKANLLRDTLRRQVARIDDRDQAGAPSTVRAKSREAAAASVA
jgi:hypothetical protein